jgi:hypothetical protein
MKIIKRKLGQETPLVWCGGEGVKNVVEKGLKLKGVDDEDVSSALWSLCLELRTRAIIGSTAILPQKSGKPRTKNRKMTYS